MHVGSEIDFENVQDFFENQLGYEFHAKIDPSKKEIENFLLEKSRLLSKKEKAEEYHCLMVFIMGHGNEVKIYALTCSENSNC